MLCMMWADSGAERCLEVQVGWPTTLATADRRPFVSRLHEAKQKHLRDMVLTGEIPLRTGAPPPLAPFHPRSLSSTHERPQDSSATASRGQAEAPEGGGCRRQDSSP